jgi:hypothetical protein
MQKLEQEVYKRSLAGQTLNTFLYSSLASPTTLYKPISSGASREVYHKLQLLHPPLLMAANLYTSGPSMSKKKLTPSDHSPNANLELCMCACVRRVQSIETNLIRVERCAPDLHSLTVASQRWCVETARDTSKFGQVLSRSKQQKIAVRFTRDEIALQTH